MQPRRSKLAPARLYTVDLNADKKSELVVPRVITVGGTAQAETLTYKSLSRLRDGNFEVFDTKLPIQHRGGRVVFLDVNGDRLPDAVESARRRWRLVKCGLRSRPHAAACAPRTRTKTLRRS
jgi:hypothetical protein